MYELKSVPLPKGLTVGQRVRFVSLDLAVRPSLALAIAHLTVDGKHQSNGLRLDLDKRIVLDCLEDDHLQAEVQDGANRIFAYIASDEAAQIIRNLPAQFFTVQHTSEAPMTAGFSA